MLDFIYCKMIYNYQKNIYICIVLGVVLMLD